MTSTLHLSSRHSSHALGVCSSRSTTTHKNQHPVLASAGLSRDMRPRGDRSASPQTLAPITAPAVSRGRSRAHTPGHHHSARLLAEEDNTLAPITAPAALRGHSRAHTTGHHLSARLMAKEDNSDGNGRLCLCTIGSGKCDRDVLRCDTATEDETKATEEQLKLRRRAKPAVT